MIYPAIDLMDGGCVRLFKGDFNQRTNYKVSPLEVARKCVEAGAEWMHIVDLDGAKNEKNAQAELIINIARESGRVVIGSLAVTNPQMVKFWINTLGPERVVIALDVNITDDGTPYPATRGWTEAGERTLWTILDDYSDSGLQTILVTDIGRDGVLGGANINLYTQIMARFPDFNLITSGGVGTLDHVKNLKALNPHGIIIGKALYENKFTLNQAIKC